MWDGEVLFIAIVAVVLSAIAGRMVATAFRRRVRTLMSTPSPPLLAPPPIPTLNPVAATPRTWADNKAAQRRLALVLSVISLLIGVTQAWWELHFVYTETPYGLVKVLVLGIAHAWMIVPILGMLWRWPWLKISLGSLLYACGASGLIWLRSGSEQSLRDVALWQIATVFPMLVALWLAGAGRARTISPYLLPVFLLLGGASNLGLDRLKAMLTDSAGVSVVSAMAGAMGAYSTVLVFIAAPWLVAVWPALWLSRVIARGYERYLFSEIIYQAAGLWFAALMMASLITTRTAGLFSFTVLGCLLILPIGFMLSGRWLLPGGRPPGLLVLRVFRRDAEVQALYHSVVDRWRSSGTTCLIAGTDLALEMLEPDELFAFTGGRLRERFIATPDDLSKRMAALTDRADLDGRYRVNEFFCFDATWKMALACLVRRSQVVLMDLRQFQKQNEGCLHELRVLSQAAHLARVVVLVDQKTDQATAHQATVVAPTLFHWVDASHLNDATADRVLRLLLEG